MSKVTDILTCSDEMIKEMGTRESGVIDYRLGQGSVSYRGGGRYLCGQCNYPENYQTHEHRGCPHIQRIQRYREEQQEALNFVMADPATEVPIA